MSESKPDLSTADLHSLKVAHDMHATVVHMLKTRFQFFHEEFEGIQRLVAFYGALRDQLIAKIEEIEPPAPKEPPKPYIVDVPAPQDEPA